MRSEGKRRITLREVVLLLTLGGGVLFWIFAMMFLASLFTGQAEIRFKDQLNPSLTTKS